MHVESDQVIRVTITLNGNVYDEIKRISKQMGLRPSTWISMVCTSKANNVNLKISPELFEHV
jgi:hypothetical protein